MSTSTGSRSEQIDNAADMGRLYGMTGPQVRRLQRLSARHRRGVDQGAALVALRAAIEEAAPARARVSYDGTAVLIDGRPVP